MAKRQKVSEGEQYANKAGHTYHIMEYKNAHNVRIRWDDCGTEEWTMAVDAQRGSLRYLNAPETFGVGFLGYGKWLNGAKRAKEGQVRPPKHLHRYWRHVLERTVATRENNIARYGDCSVVEDWYSFQVFADWANEQVNCGMKEPNGRLYHIDKDIIVPGNRVYGPDTCVFVPNEVNVFFRNTDIGNTGYPGVNYIKPSCTNAKEGYIARCCTPGGDREYLGYYNTPQEAYKKYVVAKEAGAKRLAERWEGKLDDRVIEALMNFKVAVYPT